MDKIVERAEKGLKGMITVPSDKSISHRAVIFASLAKGRSLIRNFSSGKDPHSSLEVCRNLGVDIEIGDDVIVNSSGILKPPITTLDCGNSGTTIRFMCGILAGVGFNSELIGDESLSKRPMKRVIDPLSLMGAEISAVENHPPLKIFGKPLRGIDYASPLASAQVKSCILLAGLNAEGQTSFTEPVVSRNHSEILLKHMGADLKIDGRKVTINRSVLNPCEIEIPGDISSAAYFMVAASIVPDSDVILKNVGLNHTRTGIIDVINAMGGDIEILDKRTVAGEDIGDVRVRYSNLKGCVIEKDLIPRLIDELPVIAVLASQAEGKTVVRNAEDLRNKESDRISAVVKELSKLGVNIQETPDGFEIEGKTLLSGDCELECYHDHRLAMSFYVAGLVCKKPIKINEFQWVDISFPEFEMLFKNIS